MNKKILSLMLVLVMLLTTLLTSCTFGSSTLDTTTVVDVASESTITLSMYVVSENKISEETAKQVNNAFNRITKSTFKTQVVLHFLTYDEYYSTIENMIEENAKHTELGEKAEKEFKKAKKAAKADGVATDKAWEDSWYAEHPDYIEFRETEELTGDDTTAEETVMVTVEGAENYAIAELKYPEEKAYQLDIIWIDSYDRYKQYIENDWLSRLDDELSGSSKKLKEYISPTVFQWVKWSSQGTYAIPNNSAVGEYTYLLLNKKYMDKYNYTAENIPDIYSDTSMFASYVSDIAKYEKNAIPVLGELPLTNVLYWSLNQETRSIDYSKFSIIGDAFLSGRSMDPTVSTNTPIAARNLFAVETYVKQLRAIQSYKDAGYVYSNANGKDCAAMVVKGGAELQAVYGDEYYMNILEYPRLEEDDLFSSMFGVTTFTKSLTRSMEIVTYLNTDHELRDVLQYGVEGVHYELDQSGVVKRLNNDYMMNIRNTGNEFVASPEEGMVPDIWSYGKKQNLDMKSGLLNCFRLDEKYFTEGSDIVLDMTQINQIIEASADIEKKLAAVKNSTELEALISEATSAASAAVRDQISTRKENSLYAIYYTIWMNDVGLYIPIEE